jgi:hypothetical protein
LCFGLYNTGKLNDSRLIVKNCDFKERGMLGFWLWEDTELVVFIVPEPLKFKELVSPVTIVIRYVLEILTLYNCRG